MSKNIFSRIATLINRVVDVMSQGSLERIRIISSLNDAFKDAWEDGSLRHRCTVTTSAGEPTFRHQLSAFYMRSGFKITVQNYGGITESEYVMIADYILESKTFVRQLMALGYDTLIVRGHEKGGKGVIFALKEIANFQDYMIN